MKPKVTVVMAVYNAMPYLAGAMRSILEQTGVAFHLVAVNDGSTDGSAGLLDNITDPRVTVLHQPHSGQGAARSRAFQHCDTPFTAVMDADDISLPGRLEEQFRFLQTHPEVGLVGTQFRCVGAEDRKGFVTPVPTSHDDIVASLMLGRHGIVNGSIMCRSNLLHETGGYRVSGSGEVWDMFLRLSEITRLANLSRVFLLYRVHPTSVNVRKMAETRLQCAYAIRCAELRREGSKEILFEEFMIERRRRPFLERTLESMDTRALRHYRQALPDLLGGRRFRGMGRLAVAALCSPRWTIQYVSKRLRALGT